MGGRIFLDTFIREDQTMLTESTVREINLQCKVYLKEKGGKKKFWPACIYSQQIKA